MVSRTSAKTGRSFDSSSEAALTASSVFSRLAQLQAVPLRHCVSWETGEDSPEASLERLKPFWNLVRPVRLPVPGHL